MYLCDTSGWVIYFIGLHSKSIKLILDASITEFTKNAWIWLIIVEIVLIPIVAVMIYAMISLKVGTMTNDWK